MDSASGDNPPPTMKISSSHPAGVGSNEMNSRRNNYDRQHISTIALPPAFVEDPAAFLTSIASRNPSPDGISMLAGPLSKWFLDGEEAHNSSQEHPAAHVAQLYLCAAAAQLREEQQQHQPQVMSASAAASAAAGIVASAANAMFREQQQEDKNRNARHRDETLEAVAAAAVLCSDRTVISSSGILPVLANLVATASSSASSGSSGISASNNKISSSIAASLSNLPSPTSKAFPPLTPAHTAFLQCAVLAEEFEFAETVIRGTWPIPTSSLKKKKSTSKDDSHASISIILRYYYLRGIVHYSCGRGHYAMAHRCWWTCLSVPIDVVSKIAIQAWKKLTLVQPLLDANINNRERGESKMTNVSDMNIDGSGSSSIIAPTAADKMKIKTHPGTRLPKCTPKGLSKSIHTLFDVSSTDPRKQKNNQLGGEEKREVDSFLVYTRLGPAVAAVDRASAEALVLAHESILAADGNLGMAQNCLRRVKELEVQMASEMFSVTSIEILARRWNVTPEEASQQLSEAMESRVVPCRVEEDGTIVFFSCKNSVRKNTNTNLAGLVGWMKLLGRLQEMDVDLSISSKYNSGKRKEDEGIIGSILASAGPRGVEDFYDDPAVL